MELLNLALDKSNEDQKASERSSDEATRLMNDTDYSIWYFERTLITSSSDSKINNLVRLSVRFC